MPSTSDDDELRATGDDLSAAMPGTEHSADFTQVSSPENGTTVVTLAGQATESMDTEPGRAVESVSVPGYAIEEVLGRGAMGVVYKARHLTLKRTVALKMVLAGGHARSGQLARFRIEAETVARLQHPNIVQIHEVGEAQGHPYCALEFVEGGDLASHIGGGPMPAQEAARLVEALARATQLAHSRNVVHRDLKPANILLAADGTPKITDFGLARQMDIDSGETQAGTVMGTPSYMAPEQASGRAHEAGPAADVYALGAIFYDCLTGRPPFQGQTIFETLDQVRTQEPVAPSRWQITVPLDLDTICLKCLCKEPEKRYASAAELADDLGRYQRGESILARPSSTLEKAVKWARRKPAQAVAAAVTAVALLTLLFGGVVFTDELRKERNAAQSARQSAEEHRAQAELQAAQLLQQHGHALCERGEIGQGLLWLVRGLERVSVTEAAGLDGDFLSKANDLGHLIRMDLALYGRDIHELRAMLSHQGSVLTVAFSPDGKLAITGGLGFGARVWDVAQGEPVGEPLPHPGEIRTVAFSADGKTVLTAGHDLRPSGFDFAPAGQGRARLWNLASRRPLGPPIECPCAILCAALHPDGRIVLVGRADGKAQFWDGIAGQPLGAAVAHGGSPSVSGVAFSRDGTYFATGCWGGGGAQRWNTATRQPAGRLIPGRNINAVALSPDGNALLSGGHDQVVRLWNAVSGELLRGPLGHAGVIRTATFSPDGLLALVTDDDQTARLWDLRTGLPRGGPMRHAGRVYAAAFSPDGQSVLTGEEDGSGRLWRRASGLRLGRALPAPNEIGAAGYSRDGKMIVGADRSGAISLWDAATGTLRRPPIQQERPFEAVAWNPDGSRFLSGESQEAGVVRQWDPSSGREVGPLLASGPVKALAWSPDGKTILTGSWSDYGAFPGVLLGVQRWDAATGQRIGPLLKHKGDVWAVSFSPDGKTILTGSGDRIAQLWDALTGQPLGEPLVHPFEVWSAVFSPDAKLVLTGGRDRQARVWEVASRRVVGKTMPHPGEIRSLAFSPDGKSILTGCRDSFARLWDFQTRQPIGPPLPQFNILEKVEFAAVDRKFLTAGRDRTVRQWMLPSPVPGNARQVRDWVETITGFALTPNDAIQVLHPEEWHERRVRVSNAPGEPIPG